MYPQISLDALQAENKPGSLYYRHPRYQGTWWWREFDRVSYVGGREYHRPTRLSIDFQFPVLPLRNSNGQLIDPNARTTYDTVSYWSLLFRHNREQEFEFENRRRRAHYFNPVRTAVNALVSHAMKKGVTRDEGNATLDDFWRGVDCKRTKDMDHWMRDGLRYAAVEGIMWACLDTDVDSAAEGEAVQTRGDSKPYGYWVNPLDIWDWSTDDDGELVWLKQFVISDNVRTPMEAVRPQHRFRIWYADRVEEFSTDPASGTAFNPPEVRAHKFGRVPFEPLYGVRCPDVDFPDGESMVGDFCKAANSVYNYSSLLNEIAYKQTFSQLVVPGYIDTVAAGTSTFLSITDPGGFEPKFIAPDPEQARVLMELIAGTLEQMRQSLGIGRGQQEASKQKSSAAALSLENEDKRSILGDIAAEAEDFERRWALLVLSAKTGGGKAPTMDDLPHIQYPQDFDLQALKDELDEAMSLRNLGLSPEVMGEIRRQAVARKFAGMPPDKLNGLLDSLKSVVDTPPEVGQGVAQKSPNQPGNVGQGNGSPNPGKATGAAEPG